MVVYSWIYLSLLGVSILFAKKEDVRIVLMSACAVLPFIGRTLGWW
jgi:hypothetical protein